MRRMTFGIRMLGGLLAASLGLGCAPLMVETEGHQVFNPDYRGFLTWAPRDWWQEPDAVVRALGLQDGDVVADVGAGNGYFVERLSSAVGPDGRVYATDVQAVMVRDLEVRVQESALANVEVVHSGFADPTLPQDCCDVVFFANVYKEISDRVPYVERLRPVLRSDGRVVVLGFRSDVHGPGPPSGARLAAAQVVDEFARAGFRLLRRDDFLSRQYLLVFGVADTPTPESQSDALSSARQNSAGESVPTALRAASTPEVNAP